MQIAPDANEIELGSFIADGTTGGVYKGMWRGMVCAVKRFRYSKDDKSLVQTFKNEVFLLRNLVHENLVTFYGACAVAPNLCILTELMTGSLQSLLYGVSVAELTAFSSSLLGFSTPTICCVAHFGCLLLSPA